MLVSRWSSRFWISLLALCGGATNTATCATTANGGATERFTRPGGSAYVALSPDGEHVAYWRTIKDRRRLAIAEIGGKHAPVLADTTRREEADAPLRWSESGRLMVQTSPSDQQWFDVTGRRVADAGPKLPDPTEDAAMQPEISPTLARKLQEKLPHRTVQVLSSVGRTQRHLVRASASGVALRYFIFDEPSDLLFEVGRP